MALVLDLLAATGKPLSRLVADLPRYCMVKEQFPLGASTGGATHSCNSPCGRALVLGADRGRYPEARADRRDGLRLDWDDRWVHVRASNTEPIVRVIAEAPEEMAASDWPGKSAECVVGPIPRSSP